MYCIYSWGQRLHNTSSLLRVHKRCSTVVKFPDRKHPIYHGTGSYCSVTQTSFPFTSNRPKVRATPTMRFSTRCRRPGSLCQTRTSQSRSSTPPLAKREQAVTKLSSTEVKGRLKPLLSVSERPNGGAPSDLCVLFGKRRAYLLCCADCHPVPPEICQGGLFILIYRVGKAYRK